MSADRTVGIHKWMVEIIIGIVRHRELFHNTPRWAILGNGHRDDFFKIESFKTILDRRSGTFGGIAILPVFPGQSPTNLDARSKVSFESWNHQPNETDEWRAVLHFDSPQSEWVRFKVRDDPLRCRVAFAAIEDGRKETHHFRVGIHASEFVQVAGSPSAEPKSLGFQLGCRGQWAASG